MPKADPSPQTAYDLRHNNNNALYNRRMARLPLRVNLGSRCQTTSELADCIMRWAPIALEPQSSAQAATLLDVECLGDILALRSPTTPQILEVSAMPKLLRSSSNPPGRCPPPPKAYNPKVAGP